MKLIDKDKIAAEIEKRKSELQSRIAELGTFESNTLGLFQEMDLYDDIISFLDTIEVKKVEEKFEHPNIEAKDAVEVSSRMPHIDKRLLPIAEFIMDYCSWNLHKDEWNQPVIEVPLFRVLDALVQKGKPYCEG